MRENSQKQTILYPGSKFSLYSTLMEKRKLTFLNNRILGRTAKSPIVFTLLFAAIFFLIYADTLISNLSLYPPDISLTDFFREPQTSYENFDANEEEDNQNQDPFPPSNVTGEERMEWFRRKLPELEILKSTELSQKFHGRVVEFFSKQCTVKFFMTWFSPARTFGPREFLGAETLLKANPRACLMIISRSLDTARGYGILKPLLDRGFKVLAITPDLPFLLKDTPPEAWLEEIKSGKRDPGTVALSIHLSDLIRLAILYKYGGVYLDTDFIILKDFTGLRNTVGAQSIDQVTKKWNRLNGAVMIFDVGHPILFDFLQEFATNFNGNKWGHNGPYLVSRVIERVEDTPGYEITVMPPKAFYPIDWVKITRLFKKPETEEEWKWVEDTALQLSTESYGLHLWNKITSRLVIEEGSVIERLIKDHCVVCQGHYNS